MRRLPKRPWVWALVVALACGLAYTVYRLSLPEDPITEANSSRIPVGMTVGEVETMLGPPLTTDRGEYVDGARSDVYFWRGKEGMITVWFREGRVDICSFSARNRPPWYRRWPGVRQVAQYCGW